ncbi:colicin immunity domain-containing protein [Pasteurella skyensis]|uniref:Colicin immunity domain-containing protein n=1 Tax=Phocoenobacter skyensis TaxID=97481 RepID=A0AAJ6N9I3_9PAST|nr:colicin immunity domain-containing protein [Pasteurella skyensis]MDP8162196.1 colicin immunity domain-containing protein [Pasteurella skyensis]MDP8172660.1 colicin immunity domain-containing protein [Pasteurella skyensis]MDP8176822.1 colicin immunity domain-containing protein [Pasteurella skyensis]MDP8179160.1 colicin immunity domain-containing protein [Pasteurella skyensis]MDP8183385.1 colicin immunity domain-containing protein [Pasteurella skyensis]
MVTPLIQFAIDFDKGKVSAFDFSDQYLDMWDSWKIGDEEIGRNDKDTWEQAAKIRTACDDYYPGDDYEINEAEFRALVRGYLAEIEL